MKTHKTGIVAIPLLVGAIAFLLQCNQTGVSQSGPPLQATSFNAHYAELSFTLGLGEAKAVAMPAVNRAVRIAITMVSNQDGEVAFAELPSVYSVNPGFEGFTIQLGTAYYTEANLNNLFGVSGGTNQTFVVRAAEDKSGPVQVSMWY
jgi:hypothetical protein